MRKINEIIIHCSATQTKSDIGKKEITEWHLERGFVDIGYHFVIRRDGTIEEGRPIQKIGAHCRGHNTSSIGICLVGGIDQDGNAECNYTEAQFASLVKKIKELQEQYNIKRISGHNEYDNKACPCFDVKAWVKNGYSTLVL